MKVFLALPAYNEEATLPVFLATFQRCMTSNGFVYRIVIVDDGSEDGTGRVIEEWASRLPIDSIRHPENRGLGETIRDALRLAAELAAPDDVVVTMDADNTHSPELIPQMVPCIEQGNDVVIASRYRPGSKVLGLSAFRHAMSYGARAVMQLAVPLRGVRDYTSGFRAYRASTLQEAFRRHNGLLVTERGFACIAEILLNLGKMGARMCEVPMVLRYDQKAGASKMKVGRTVWKTIRMILRYRFS